MARRPNRVWTVQRVRALEVDRGWRNPVARSTVVVRSGEEVGGEAIASRRWRFDCRRRGPRSQPAGSDFASTMARAPRPPRRPAAAFFVRRFVGRGFVLLSLGGSSFVCLHMCVLYCVKVERPMWKWSSANRGALHGRKKTNARRPGQGDGLAGFEWLMALNRRHARGPYRRRMELRLARRRGRRRTPLAAVAVDLLAGVGRWSRLHLRWRGWRWVRASSGVGVAHPRCRRLQKIPTSCVGTAGQRRGASMPQGPGRMVCHAGLLAGRTRRRIDRRGRPSPGSPAKSPPQRCPWPSPECAADGAIPLTVCASAPDSQPLPDTVLRRPS